MRQKPQRGAPKGKRPSSPDRTAAIYGQGLALLMQGRAAAAQKLFLTSLALRPDHAEAENNLGVALALSGHPARAPACFARAVRLRPDYSEAQSNLGNGLKSQGLGAAAQERYRCALILRPDNADSFYLVAGGCDMAGRLAEAEHLHRRALRLKPGLAQAHHGLAAALLKRRQKPAALAAAQTALALHPSFGEALCTLGMVLAAAENFASARRALDHARNMAPTLPEIPLCLGKIARAEGDMIEAEAQLRRALCLRQPYPEAALTLGHLHLLLGRLREGWQGYEWRWRGGSSGLSPRPWPRPQWQGEPLAGRRLLVHAEQGAGDSLQFYRYLPSLAAAAEVIFEVQPPLLRLLAAQPTAPRLVPAGDVPPDFDLHCPLLSLPAILGTELATIPAATPYLTPPAAPLAAWRQRLGGCDKVKVGLVWAGNPQHDNDHNRSLPIETLSPLLDMPGLSFYSLQKDGADLARLPPGKMTDLAGELGDYADSAAAIACLDLVISVDTSVAHLAGALGCPTWVMLPFAPDWRWLLDRDDSPWYPAIRLFRQPTRGDWPAVIDAVAKALNRLRVT